MHYFLLKIAKIIWCKNKLFERVQSFIRIKLTRCRRHNTEKLGQRVFRRRFGTGTYWRNECRVANESNLAILVDNCQRLR